MTPYNNASSGIISYEIGGDYIKIDFERGGIYTYSYDSAGEGMIEQMKALALMNDGLNTFVNKNKPGYSHKG